MAIKQREFVVSYQLHGSGEPAAARVCAVDEACALGLVLDALDLDDDPAFDWVVISAESEAGPGNRPAPPTLVDRLPPEVARAYEQALAEARTQ